MGIAQPFNLLEALDARIILGGVFDAVFAPAHAHKTVLAPLLKLGDVNSMSSTTERARITWPGRTGGVYSRLGSWSLVNQEALGWVVGDVDVDGFDEDLVMLQGREREVLCVA